MQPSVDPQDIKSFTELGTQLNANAKEKYSHKFKIQTLSLCIALQTNRKSFIALLQLLYGSLTVGLLAP